MITNRDFVVLSDDWNGLPTSTIHLFRRIARHNRVFWFNTINHVPRLTWKNTTRVASLLLDWVGDALDPKEQTNGHNSADHDGPCIVRPCMFPWFKPPIRRLNRRSLLRSYDRLRESHSIRAPIVVTTYPSTVDFVKSVSPALKIYYCVDEWLDYPNVNAADWRDMEDELLDSIDAFLATSRNLETKSRGLCPTLYLPHGVDFDHFCRQEAGHETGPAMQHIPRPIVGFFGLIGQWVDLKLVAALSKTFPQASFVLIGESLVDMAIVRNCRNVYSIGAVSYRDLPRYASCFDIGLIPFVKSRLTAAVNPLKLLEYYALGLPVLATRLPELQRVGGPIHLASTVAEFCQCLHAMLDGESCHEANEAIELAKRNTWDQRVEQLSEFIAGLD